MNHYTISREKFFSKEEMKRLLKVCEKNALTDLKAKRITWVTRHMLVRLALYSGLRVSEIAALKIGDLHFNGKENYLIVQHGKGERKRDVYLDTDLVKHLQDYLEIKKKWREPIHDDAPLFSGRRGNHYSSTALHISFKKAIEEAGLPKKYSIHSTRHTYATFLFAKTKSIRFVQKQLGHASIATTSLYADILPELNQSLAEAILKA